MVATGAGVSLSLLESDLFPCVFIPLGLVLPTFNVTLIHSHSEQTTTMTSTYSIHSDTSDSESSSSGSKPLIDFRPSGFDSFDGTMIKHTDFYKTCHSFNLSGLTFDELPENARKFLVGTGLFPNEFANLEIFFQALLEVRRARRDRLERTLEGVNRAIVKEMLASHERSEDESIDESCRAVLSGVLQPEWREHLDQYVEEIDALIWLDMTARAESTNQLTLEQYMVERQDDVERMVEFALRCLQKTFDKVKREMQAEWIMREMLEAGEAQGDVDEAELDEAQGHISEVASEFGSDDGQWVAL